MPTTDPWLWTTEEIIAELRNSTTPLRANSASKSVAPFTPLEHYIREHHFTGAAFLTTSDFQVSDPVQRQYLSSVLDSLRRRSITYQEHSTMKRVEALDLNRGLTRRRRQSNDVDVINETGGKKRKVAQSISPENCSMTVTAASVDPMGDSPGAVENSEWGHLLKWQDLDGNEEVNWAELEQLEHEQQPEQEEAEEENAEELEQDEPPDEPAQPRSRLTDDQIVDIINERIEHYTNSWIPNKGEKRGEEVAYDVEGMWQEAETTKQRPILIAKHECNLAYYSQRLDRLCDEILKSPARNAEKIRQQCTNLELTINSMQLEEWLLAIYKLEPVDDGEPAPGPEPDSAESSTRHILEPPGPPPITPLKQAKSSFEIIDLGSPSEISEDGGSDGVVVDEDTRSVSGAQDVPLARPYRSDTPDSVIMMDVVETPLHTHPEKAPEGEVAKLPMSLSNNGDEPEKASIRSVQRWRWSDLVATHDRKRIVSKAVNGMEPNDREEMRLRLRQISKAHMTKEITSCIEMLSNGHSRMPGVLPRDQPKIVLLTRLFLSWWLCDNYLRDDPSTWRLDELRKCLLEGSPDTGTFYDYVRTIMSTTFSEEALMHPERPSQIEIIEISDDE